MACHAVRSLYVLLALGLVLPSTSLAKKKNKDKGEPVVVEVTPDTPDDPVSKKFAKGLLDANIKNFSPTDAAMSARFLYDTLQFKPDNTWLGVGFVEIVDERMECEESGHWAMDAAESPTVAMMTWKVEKTDCAGRDAGSEVRAQVTLEKDGGIDVLFR